jgi:uncharacterized membrane protein YhaH (DUF805 family)
MRIHFSDLWQWKGRASRGVYFLAGFIGCAIKFLLDRAISSVFFHRQIHLIDYWQPLGATARLKHLSRIEINWLTVLLLTALPFIYIGLAMTVRRVRDIGYPVWLAMLFFAPVANLLFFLVLCCLPSAERRSGDDPILWTPSRGLGELMPRSELGSAAVSVIISALLGVAATFTLTNAMGSYGWSLFLALPFCMGLFAALLYSARAPRSASHCLMISLLPVVVIGIVLLAVAMEGIVCLLMAAPIALVLAGFGGWMGHVVQETRWMVHSANAISKSSLCIVLLLLPISAGIERAVNLAAPAYRVQSSIEINAPPAQVWQKVIAFSEIPPPTEMIFRAGIAYPIRAEITDHGHGPGAIRRCEFSTGPFVEPIEVWDEPHLLRFGVTENPAPLNEISPYGNIRPPHLHGYFVSHRGQFLLTELPGGHTRLEGTTWYSDAIWPAQYWRLWSDYIIHRIHMRVLEHIKVEAETSSLP